MMNAHCKSLLIFCNDADHLHIQKNPPGQAFVDLLVMAHLSLREPPCIP